MNIVTRWILIILGLGLILAGSVWGACVEPTNPMTISSSTTLCNQNGTYYYNNNTQASIFKINAHNIVLDCNSTKLYGNKYGIAVDLNYKDNVTIKNCILTNYSWGIKGATGTDNATIMNNSFYNNTISVSLYKSKLHNVYKNIFYDNNYGIYMNAFPYTQSLGYSIFNNNTFGNHSIYGIYLLGVGRINITNNNFLDIHTNAMRLTRTNYSIIKNNYIYNSSATTGIRIDNLHAFNNKVINNTINHSRNCFDAQGAYSLFENNTCDNGYHASINAVTDYEDRCYSWNNTIQYNLVYNGRIYLNGICNSTIQYNYIDVNHQKGDQSKSWGIGVDGLYNATTQKVTSYGNKIRHNTIINSSDYALSLNCNNCSTLIWNNTLIDNPASMRHEHFYLSDEKYTQDITFNYTDNQVIGGTNIINMTGTDTDKDAYIYDNNTYLFLTQFNHRDYVFNYIGYKEIYLDNFTAKITGDLNTATHTIGANEPWALNDRKGWIPQNLQHINNSNQCNFSKGYYYNITVFLKSSNMLCQGNGLSFFNYQEDEIMNLSGYDNITVREFNFINGTRQMQGRYSDNDNFINNNHTNCGDSCIFFQGATNTLIENSRFVNGSALTGNKAVIYGGTDNNLTIKNNYFSFGFDTAIRAYYAMSGVKIYNNTFSRVDRGIDIQSGNNQDIRDNLFDNFTVSYDGYCLPIRIGVQQSSQKFTNNVTIKNNIMRTLAATAILLQGGSNITIKKNYADFLSIEEKGYPNDLNEMSTFVIASPIYKGFDGSATESITDTWKNTFENMSVGNLVIEDNIVDNDVYAYLKAVGVKNLSHDFTNYYYKKFAWHEPVFNITEYWLNDYHDKVLIRYYTPTDGWVITDLIPFGYYMGYPLTSSDGYHRANIKLGKQMDYFINTNDTYSYNLSIYNLTAPNSICNNTQATCEQNKAGQMNYTLAPGERVFVFDNMANKPYPLSMALTISDADYLFINQELFYNQTGTGTTLMNRTDYVAGVSTWYDILKNNVLVANNVNYATYSFVGAGSWALIREIVYIPDEINLPAINAFSDLSGLMPMVVTGLFSVLVLGVVLTFYSFRQDGLNITESTSTVATVIMVIIGMFVALTIIILVFYFLGKLGGYY